MTPLVALALLGAGGAAVALAASGGGEPEPPIPQGTAQPLPPVAAPPQRNALPGIDWTDYAGEARVEPMADSPRFPAQPPGDTRIVLATVADLEGMRGDSFRVMVDAYVEDTSDAASLVQIARALKRGLKPSIMPAFHHTAFGERLARRFKLQHGQAIPAAKYSATLPLPTQLPLTPAPRRYVGEHCTIVNEVPSDIQQLGADWGIGSGIGAYYLFDTDKCGERGPAYAQRKPPTGPKYTALYSLQLEGEGSHVVLTATVARLPITQLLSWRAFAAIT